MAYQPGASSAFWRRARARSLTKAPNGMKAAMASLMVSDRDHPPPETV
jgi:hypothetical protein